MIPASSAERSALADCNRASEGCVQRQAVAVGVCLCFFGVCVLNCEIGSGRSTSKRGRAGPQGNQNSATGAAEGTMTDFMRDEPGTPKIGDRATFQARKIWSHEVRTAANEGQIGPRGRLVCPGNWSALVRRRQGPRVWQQCITEQRWPVASAVIRDFTPHSRTDLAKRNNSYVPVYWMKFTVALDVSPQKCPSSMRRSIRGAVECVGIYETVWSTSEERNWQWGSKHQLLSTVQVRYDPTGNSGATVFCVGEPLRDGHAWTDIAGLCFMLALSLVCFISAKAEITKADRWELLS
jgi:hypothetical protein